MVYSISNDIVSGTLNTQKLQDEILAADCVSNFNGIIAAGDRLEIFCAVTDQETLDAIVHAHVAISLDDNKAVRIIQIDKRTDAIIAAGFLYDGNTFSLSTQAQMNWMGLYTLKDLQTWPIGVTTAANETYQLALLNLVAFIATGSQVIKNAVGSGRALKIAINAATTQEELDAIVDTR